ncbi:hypothetical protein CRUP_013472 [Coryphaenoides rupestris]|nr:hypothetical protein CRUP_013472 [Coryphaenoides rupestris]
MAVAHTGQASLVHSLAALLRNHGDEVLSGGSTLTLQACTLAQLAVLFERYLLSRPGPPHGFLALASHPAETRSLLELQFLFDVLQKTVSLKLVEVPGSRAQSAVKIFPFKSLKSLERAPSLPPSARGKLHTLILRNNELETINGVEQLASLQHVDLAYNLLLEHSQLAPLALLHSLHTLSLEGNPLFFQRSHRPATVRHLSPRAARLRVLPKPGQFIGQSQAPPPVAWETERGAEEGSSGAGELSDSMSVGEVAVTRAKVKVRRASISEPSDTDHQPRLPTSSQVDIVLPHQKDIERMDSFREQLGEDWLRYQHHLEGAPPSTFTPTPLPVSTNGLDLPSNQAPPRAPEAPEVPGVLEDLPPAVPHPQPRVEAGDGEAEQEAEEPTLQWSCQSPGETQSTLENEDVPGPPRKSGNTREEEDEEEEEEDLGGGGGGRGGGGRGGGDEQQQQEEEEEDETREGSMLSDMLCGVAELNQQRDVAMATCPPSSARRQQCLRCGSEFTQQGASGEDPRESRHSEEENSTMCPECGSDHVVDLAIQSAPSSSTPIKCTGGQDSPALNSFSGDLLSRDTNLSSSPIPGSTGSTTGPRTLDTSAVSTTTSAANASTSQDPTSLFVTAQESCMLAGEDQADSWAESSLSHSLETHGKEELAGSYCYASTGVSVAAHGDDQSGLFLDMEVFEEEEEELHSFLKMSRVRFGQSGECPSLLVVSNQRFYFLEMTSHAHNGQLSDWLQKRDSHPITELSYLEVGLGSQTIHMAFEEGALAYTLLVRDDTRCKSFFSRLTGVVRELAPKSSSKLKSISTSRLHPQHHLCWTPLTVLVTKETLYLLNEDHQWCKSPPSVTANESREPSSGAATILESQPISCVSSARLWPSDTCRMDIQLYDETVKEERTWSLRAETPQLTAQLLTYVRTRWEAMFGVALATALHAANADAT